MDERKEEANQRRLQLQDLPHLILFHILEYLDVSSKICAWKASPLLRQVLRSRVFLSRLNLSERRVPRETCHFLRDTAAYVEDVDLSCAQGLSEKEAVAALSSLVNLRSLDVTYTAITLRGASNICNSCPRLIRLACNFTYTTAESFFDIATFLSSSELKESFRNLESAKFVNLSSTSLEALDVLSMASNLKEYKCIQKPVMECSLISDSFTKAISEHPNLQFFNCHTLIDVLPQHFIPSKFYNTWKFVAIVYAADIDTRLVFLSPGLCQVDANRRYHSELFTEMSSSEMIEWYFTSTVDLFAWRSDQVELGTSLYSEVLREVESNLSIQTCIKLNSPNKIHSYPNEIRSYRICRSTFKKLNEESDSQYDLNLSASIPVDQKLMITLESCCYYYHPCSTILDINIPFLHNIVHLSLRDETLDSSLFNVLFRNCVILETLDIEIEIKDLQKLTENLHLCRSVRNICIGVLKNYENDDILLRLLPALVVCPRIENVCILGVMECSKINIIEKVFESFLVGCPNLCSLRFCGNFSFRFKGDLRCIISETLMRLDMNDVYVSFELPAFYSLKMLYEYPPSLVFFEPRNQFDGLRKFLRIKYGI